MQESKARFSARQFDDRGRAFCLEVRIHSRIGNASMKCGSRNNNKNKSLLQASKLLFQSIITAALFAVCSGARQPANGVMQAGAPCVQLAAVALENRFIATGVIISIQPPAKGIHKFILKIEKIEPLDGYANFGADYQGKEVEILSEIGMPSSLKVGAAVSVVLRVFGDEWQQAIFLVEVIKNGSGK